MDTFYIWHLSTTASEFWQNTPNYQTLQSWVRIIFWPILWIFLVRNFIEDKTVSQVLSFEFCEILQAVTLLKLRRRYRGVFSWILRNISACSFVRNETQPHVFSCEFLEIFQPVTLLKTRLCQKGAVLWIWEIFQSTSVSLNLHIWQLMGNY